MPSEAITIINSLLARAAKIDPVMLDILQSITDELARHGFIIDPAPIVSGRVSSGDSSSIPPPVIDFDYSFTTRNVKLFWTAPTVDVVYYEIRKGATWETASRILITAEREVYLDPLTVGSHTYFIKVLSIGGVYSVSADELIVVVPAIGAITITPSIIDQNILLYWTVPTSTFEIKEYKVTKDGFEIGKVTATFAATIEALTGTYIYGVTAIDIAGNESAESTVEVNVIGAPDFILRAEVDSDLSGTKTNAILEDNYLILPIDIVKTYQDHFDDNSWASPQAQITAGYPYYAQPGTVTAEYEEVIDIGVLYSSTVINISWNLEIIIGSFVVTVSTRVSDDGVVWSSPLAGQTVFVGSVRYIEITVTFTGNNDAALAKFFNFHVSLSVKEAMDSGEVDAISTDVGGTAVTFNTPFRDVDSITLTVEGTTVPYVAIYDFNDVPDPTGFSVYVYDAAGARASKKVTWKARGII